MFRVFIILVTIFVSSYSLDTQNSIDINKLSKEAKAQNKHIMVFLHKDYCGFCERMEQDIDSKDIDEIIKKDFIFVSLNINRDSLVTYQWFKGTNHQFAKEFNIGLYPALIFINGDNKAVFLTIGYRKKEELLNILKFINTKSYKDMDLETFKSNLEFQDKED